MEMAVFFQLPAGKAVEELIPQNIFPDRPYPPGAYQKMIKVPPPAPPVPPYTVCRYGLFSGR